MFKVGIIGCGIAGREYIRAFQRLSNCFISGVYDLDLNQALACAQEFNLPVLELEKLIDGVHLVCIATPTPTHLGYVELAVAHGKNVICETPLARDLSEAQKIISLCKEKGVQLVPAHFQSLSGALSKVAEKRDKDSSLSSGMARITRRRPDIPESVNGWRHDLAQSGGAFLELALQDIFFLQKIYGFVNRVMASTVKETTFKGWYVLISLGFENGAIAHLDVNCLPTSQGKDEFEFAYKGGLIAFSEEGSTPLKFAFESQETGVVHTVNPVYAGIYEVGLEAVMNALERNEALPFQPEDSYRALTVALAALESASTGDVVMLRQQGGEER